MAWCWSRSQKQCDQKARRKIGWHIFQNIPGDAVNPAYNLWPEDDEQFSWHGMSVFVAEGSKFNLPAAGEIRKYFDPGSGLENSPELIKAPRINGRQVKRKNAQKTLKSTALFQRGRYKRSARTYWEVTNSVSFCRSRGNSHNFHYTGTGAFRGPR